MHTLNGWADVFDAGRLEGNHNGLTDVYASHPILNRTHLYLLTGWPADSEINESVKRNDSSGFRQVGWHRCKRHFA